MMPTSDLSSVLPVRADGTTAVAPIAGGKSPRWRRVGLAVVLAPLAIFGGLVGLALVEPGDGPGDQVISLIEAEVRKNEGLHYNIHRGLAHAFSLCPCTAGLAASQFEKANYHRPK